MRREQLTRLNKAILVAAVGALLVGCGGSSSDRQPETTNQLKFDGGLSEQGADVSTVAALERTTGALVDDGNAFDEFIATLNQDLALGNGADLSGDEISTLGLADPSKRLFDLAFFSARYDGDRGARLERRRDQNLVTPSTQELPEGEWTSRLTCIGGGHLRRDLQRETDVDGGTSVLKETLLQTFEKCAVGVENGEQLVLTGTWKTETDEREAVKTLANGSVEGQWTDKFTMKIDLRGSRSGIEDALVLDGTLSGEDSGDWSENSDGVKGTGMFILNVERMEARLKTNVGNPVYVGQLDGSLIEEFAFRGTTSELLAEDGSARISGKLVSSGMKGAVSISTEKMVRYAGSLEDLEEACPSEGIVVVSGARGDEVEIAFGLNTGNTGQEVRVEVGGDSRLYPSCAEADYLGPIFYGPFSQYTDGAAVE